MEKEKIVFNVGLCSGRHEMPVSEYIFQEIENPCDVESIEKMHYNTKTGGYVPQKFI